MRSILRILAALLLVGAVGFWAVKGANRGWTKDRVEVRVVEEVTGLEEIRYEDRYVPGVEFLGGATVSAGIVFALSFCFRKPETFKPVASS